MHDAYWTDFESSFLRPIGIARNRNVPCFSFRFPIWGYMVLASGGRSLYSKVVFSIHLFQQRLDDRFDIQILQIRIRLSGANEDDRLAGDVRHRDGRTNLQTKRWCSGMNSRFDPIGPGFGSPLCCVLGHTPSYTWYCDPWSLRNAQFQFSSWDCTLCSSLWVAPYGYTQ